MSMRNVIHSKLEQGLAPLHLDVVDESHMHNVPPGAESHFRVVVASGKFDGMRRLARHRLVNQILSQELAGGVHALAVHAVSPGEWAESGNASPESPACRGGDGSISAHPGRKERD